MDVWVELSADRVALGGERSREARVGERHIIRTSTPGTVSESSSIRWNCVHVLLQLVDSGINIAILLGQAKNPFSQSLVSRSLNDADGLSGILGNESRHILEHVNHNSFSVRSSTTYEFQHSTDGDTGFFLVLGNSLAAKQATFLGSIPVELDRTITRDITAVSEDAEGFQDTGSAGAVIISTRRRQQREEIVHGILMGAEDSDRRRIVGDLGLESSNDGRLWECVWEHVKRNVSMEGSILDDL